MQLFCIGSDNVVDAKWQTAPNSSSWTSWDSIVGTTTTAESAPNSEYWPPWVSFDLGGVQQITTISNNDRLMALLPS